MPATPKRPLRKHDEAELHRVHRSILWHSNNITPSKNSKEEREEGEEEDEEEEDDGEQEELAQRQSEYDDQDDWDDWDEDEDDEEDGVDHVVGVLGSFVQKILPMFEEEKKYSLSERCGIVIQWAIDRSNYNKTKIVI